MLAQINSLRFFSQLNSTSALLNLSGFKNSCDDMGPRPVGKTLDQKNPQGHYERRTADRLMLKPRRKIAAVYCIPTATCRN